MSSPNYPSFRVDGDGAPDSSLQHPAVRELEKKRELNAILKLRLVENDEPAAFSHLVREVSLEVLNDCLSAVRDQEVTLFLLNSLLSIGGLLGSEALLGIEKKQSEFRALRTSVPQDPARAKLVYDRHAEELGRYLFALDRRLRDIEESFSGCTFSGSAEHLRGRYGQRVRDLAGGMRFLREDLVRWARRYVPLPGMPEAEEGGGFLLARVDRLIDDLGLRLKEVRENLSAVVFDELTVFIPTLTRKEVFKRDLENLLDIDAFLEWLSDLVRMVRRYDEGREAESLEELKTRLSHFEVERFPALAGIRESDHALFVRSARLVRAYEPGHSSDGEDPIHVFLLLLVDLEKGLSQRKTQSAPVDAASD